MIKLALLLVLGALCVAQGAKTGTTAAADMDFLVNQNKIYELLFYVKQRDLTDAEFYEIGKNYNIQKNINKYKDKDVVLEFLSFYDEGVLSRDAIFSPYYDEHLQEVYRLYKLFYSSKDFNTLYETACWARYYMNDGVFTTAFTNAVSLMWICKNMKVPPIFEIYPNLFFNGKAIQDAHQFKMVGGTDEGTGYRSSFHSNDTGEHLMPFHDEYTMDYYLEDVSLNAYYYYVREIYPFWLNSKEYKNIPTDIRGHMYYYLHQQLYARYYLERLSNDLGEIEDLDFYKPVYPGFFSTLTYANGVAFPSRARFASVPYYKYKYLKEINILESRIVSAIDSGYVIDESGEEINIYTPEGFNYLANIIEGNRDSCNRRFYGMYDALARDILGFNYDYADKNKEVPSALQCYSTSIRDPAFFILYKKIMSFFFRYKAQQRPYTESEIGFPGVKIESATVDKLTTHFDYCKYLINNAVSVNSFREGLSLRLTGGRYCLKYKPFTFRLNVDSKEHTKAVVKIFLGPAYDYVSEDYTYLYKYYKNFVELDNFVVTLKPGGNIIERPRPDPDCPFMAFESVSSTNYYEKLQSAIKGSQPFTFSEQIYSFPDRLTLPKGKVEGMRYKMFYYLGPYEENTSTPYEFPIFGKYSYYGKAFGYPLDRPMYSPDYYSSNMLFQDVYIYHEDDRKYPY